jgi:hypothetical protein
MKSTDFIADEEMYYIQTGNGRVRDGDKWKIVTLKEGMEILKTRIYEGAWLRAVKQKEKAA